MTVDLKAFVMCLINEEINMKKIFKKIFCLHLNWNKGRPLGQTPHFNDYSVVLGKGYIVPWTCTECGKVKQFTESDPPIQHIDDT